MTWHAMADMRFRMPGGYFVGPDTDGTPKFGPVGTRLSGWMTKIRLGWDRPTLVPELLRQLVADLVRWQVGTVVVGPMDPPRDRGHYGAVRLRAAPSASPTSGRGVGVVGRPATTPWSPAHCRQVLIVKTSRSRSIPSGSDTHA
jgi:hypothetical protein